MTVRFVMSADLLWTWRSYKLNMILFSGHGKSISSGRSWDVRSNNGFSRASALMFAPKQQGFDLVFEST